MLIAERTFAGLQADAWAAIGIWVTIGVYLLLAWFARTQVKEAQALRVETSRPYMVVEMKARSIVMSLSFKNVGQTSARNVVIRFDERLEGATRTEMKWQDSAAFTRPIPSFPPGHEIRFFFDSFLARQKKGLPMLISGTCSYEDAAGRRYEAEPFLIDLDVYEGANIAEKDVADLVSEVEKIRKEIDTWPNRGLRVDVSDRDRSDRASHRYMTAIRVRRARQREGPQAALREWWGRSRPYSFWERWFGKC